MKIRIALGMLGLGIVLIAVFFLIYDPNSVLKDTAEPQAQNGSPTTVAAAVDSAAVQKFLDAFNLRYLDLYRTWQIHRYRVLIGDEELSSHQVATDHQALLSFAGNDDNIASILRMHAVLTLNEFQDRQLGVARRLAALRPARLPAPLAEQLDEPGPDPQSLPSVFAVRKQATAALGYPSYLDLLADDLDEDAASWAAQLHTIQTADQPLYDLLHNYLAGLLASRRKTDPPDMIPADWLGSGEPGTVDVALAALSPAGPAPTSGQGDVWTEALAFRSALALPALPDDLLRLQPVMIPTDSRSGQAQLFSLDLGPSFGITLIGPGDRNLYLKTVGVLGLADLFLACDRAQLPPLLRGSSSRAFGRAIAHLYTLAAECAPRADDDHLSGQELLAEAVRGPILHIPLDAGAYLNWLQGMNRGVFPGPVVTEKFWIYAASQARISRPDGNRSQPTLPAAAFGQDTGPAAPLDDVLGWVIAHQLHRYICRHLLRQDVHHADYRGSAKVGDFLLGLMGPGKSRDWEMQLHEATGENLDPGAMLEYYQPLADWLGSQ